MAIEGKVVEIALLPWIAYALQSYMYTNDIDILPEQSLMLTMTLLVHVMIWLWIVSSDLRTNSYLQRMCLTNTIYSIGSLFPHTVSGVLVMRCFWWCTTTMNLPGVVSMYRYSTILPFVMYLLHIVSDRDVFLWLACTSSIISAYTKRLYSINTHPVCLAVQMTVYGVSVLGYRFRYIDSIYYICILTFLDLISKLHMISHAMTCREHGDDVKQYTQMIRLIDSTVGHDVVKPFSSAITEEDIRQYIHCEITNDLFPDLVRTTNYMTNPTHSYTTKHMCIVFVDRVDFSQQMLFMNLEDVVYMLHNYQTMLDVFGMRYGMQKVDTIGDGYFTVVESVESAIRFCQDAIKHFGVSVRIGLHIGDIAECMLGISRLRIGYVGSDVNIANRIETAGTPGVVTCSGEFVSAYRHAGCKLATFVCVGTKRLKGIGDKKLYQVAFGKSPRKTL